MYKGIKMINNKTINNFKQNRATYVVDDIMEKVKTKGYDITREDLYEILLKRGIFKWLKVRKYIINFKEILKKAVTDLTLYNIDNKSYFKSKLSTMSPTEKYWYTRGKIEAYIGCRKNLRLFCHSTRWTAANDDKKAAEFLRSLEE